MADELTLAGVSADRRRLLLVDARGAEFTVDITPDLRAAVRGEDTRIGQLEMKMSSSIRPREIQTRIRAGETPDVVAQAAGTTVEAIMPYVAPVLAEREHVAERAQRASLRRAPGEGPTPHTQSRVLGDAFASHLRAAGADPAGVVWDAYRRETGRWVLTGTFTAGERSGTARFTYDAPGSYVLADNDDARWLVGDAVAAAAPEPARDDLREVRERRLAAVSSDELPLGDLDGLDRSDGSDGPGRTPAAEPTVDDDLPAAAAPAAEPLRDTTAPAGTRADGGDAAAAAAAADPADPADVDAAEQARHRRPVQKKRGRASVPSWDEIMFGGPGESSRG